MIRRVVVVAVVAFSLLARVTPAVAQPEAGTIFVTGAALAAIEDGPTYDTAAIFDSALAGNDGGTVAGGTVGVGVHLSPRVSVRAEWSTTAELRDETTGSEILPQATPFTFGSALTVFPAHAIIESRTTTRRRSTAVFSLLGYHFAGRRVSLDVMGGLGLVRRSQRWSYETRFTAPTLGTFVPQPGTSESKSAAYHAVAVVGADAAVSVASRLAVVPQVRAYVLGGALSLRPGLGLRWTF